MSQKDNLLERILSRPKDFTVAELDTLMGKCGCVKHNRGKTSGSAIAYIHTKTNLKCRFHSPHPQKELKRYVIDGVIDFLRKAGEL